MYKHKKMLAFIICTVIIISTVGISFASNNNTSLLNETFGTLSDSDFVNASDNKSRTLGTYTDMVFKLWPRRGSLSGTSSVVTDANPIYGRSYKFSQAASDGSNGQWHMINLTNAIALGGSTNDYAEIMFSAKLENSSTGLIFNLGSADDYGSGDWILTLNMKNNGELTLNESTTLNTGLTANSSYFDLRIQLDLKNKALTNIWVNDTPATGATYPVALKDADQIKSMKIYVGRADRAGDMYVDNLRVVKYTSDTGVSKYPNKYKLLKLVSDNYNKYDDGEKPAGFDDAVAGAVNIYNKVNATQEEADTAWATLNGIINPVIPDPTEFTLIENYETGGRGTAYAVTDPLGGAIEYGTYVENNEFGEGVMKLRTDLEKPNLNTTMKLGFGSNAINIDNEMANCYIEASVDLANYNMRAYSKNIWIRLGYESDSINLGNLFLAYGDELRLTVGSYSQAVIGKISEPSLMNNIKIVARLTDENGDKKTQICGIYLNGTLLSDGEVSYPIDVPAKSSSLNELSLQISNLKDDDVSKSYEFGMYADNVIVTKYYGAGGSSKLNTASELVLKMRNMYKDLAEDKYDITDKPAVIAALESAELVYNTPTSTMQDISDAYDSLFALEKQLNMPAEKGIEVVGTTASVEKLESENAVDISTLIVASNSLTQAVNPTVVGILFNGDTVKAIDVKSQPISAGGYANINVSFDLTTYSEAEKAEMYAKVFVYENIKANKKTAEPVVLFKAEAEVDSTQLRDAESVYFYNMLDGESVKVVSVAETEQDLMIFDNAFDYTDFSDSTLKSHLKYIGTGEKAYILGGMPKGTYKYMAGSEKGSFAALEKNDFDTVISKLNADYTEGDVADIVKVMGLNDSLYANAQTAGLDIKSILDDCVEGYNVTAGIAAYVNINIDIETLSRNVISCVDIVYSFNQANNNDAVTEEMKKCSGIVANYSAYNDLTDTKKDTADDYIYNNKSTAIDLKTLNTLIGDAVTEAGKNNGGDDDGETTFPNTTYPSVGSGGGGGGAIKDENKNETVENDNIIEANTKQFGDLQDVAWAKEAIAYLVNKGSINGKSDKMFAPNDDVTREEFVKILLISFDFPLESLKSTFDDVDDGEWHTPYVMSGVKYGIINGIGDGCFGIGQKLTREDAAVLIYRVLQNKGVACNENGEFIEFADTEYISDYAKEAVVGMTKSAIINGKDNNRFAAKESCTRAEAAKMIYESCMYMIKEGSK